MQIKKFPHEFLARWGRDGKLQGYHVITVDIACDDAGVILKKDPADPASENLLERFGEPTTAERAGVTLDEILGEIHTAALAVSDADRSALVASNAEVQRLAGELAAANARIAELTGGQNA